MTNYCCSNRFVVFEEAINSYMFTVPMKDSSPSCLFLSLFLTVINKFLQLNDKNDTKRKTNFYNNFLIENKL